ncbi:MAG: creatininase family protein [Spirochaetota bacterium]
MKKVRLEEFTQKEFQDSYIDKAILVFGSCESHGEHLPFGSDVFVPHSIAVEVAEQIEDTVAVPPLWYGMSLHYRHKPMCISLTDETLIMVIKNVLESLVYWGIKKALIINGHDGNIASIEVAAREVKVKNPEMGIAVIPAWWENVSHLVPEGTFEVWNGLGHGGEGETSMNLATVPELVDMDQARGMIPEMDPVVNLVWNFEELTDYGASGAPEKGSVEKGKITRQALITYIVDFIKRMDEQGWRFKKHGTK